MTAIFQAFGYKDMKDYVTTMLVWKYHKFIFYMGTVLGITIGLVNKYLGVSEYSFKTFMILIITEFVTGLWASLANNQKISSDRWNRGFIKLAGYTGVLAGIHQLTFDPRTGSVAEVIHTIIMLQVIVGLVLSNMENVVKMDPEEKRWLTRALKKVLNKYIDL